MEDFYDHDDQHFDHQREIEGHFHPHPEMDHMHREQHEFEQRRNELYRYKHSTNFNSSPFSILAAVSFGAFVLFASQGARGADLAIPFVLMIVFILAPLFKTTD